MPDPADKAPVRGGAPVRAPAAAHEVIRFGRVEIQPALREIRVDGAVAPIGARGFDLLIALIARSDRVVGKDELFAAAWPGLVVEENNLSVQIAALRRVLGPGAITTVTGRGYRFTAMEAASASGARADPPAGNLPAREAVLFGREDELARLTRAFRGAACVTVCGAAGVGKTSLAGVAARRIAEARRPAQGVWCVELANIREPGMLVPSICGEVGIELSGEADPGDECFAHLRHCDMLLVLDNCEHLVEAVAQFVERLRRDAPGVALLATSQEPLHVDGEEVLRLGPLDVPESAAVAGAAEFAAVRMLRERVQWAMGASFEPGPDELADLIEICRQLDGIPLALEFAATRVPLLGVSGVRTRLHDRLRLLTGGTRTTPARHRSLQAALEWSHQLLSPATRSVLHRLAVFPSGFSLMGARLLLGVADESDLIERLDVLVDRSLVTVSTEPRLRYRLLETTRAFALDALVEEADGVDWPGRLAHAMGQLCTVAARERDSTWMWQEMPNARSALTWAVEHPGHAIAAVRIATYTSVVLGAGGAIREAIENLLRVRPLVDETCGPDLQARYWHWLGRLGVEGRLLSSLCIESLSRADRMFDELGESRHRIGCQRHLAEAELRAGRLDAAEAHIEAARRLEASRPSSADRMRRLRVEALLAGARGEYVQALRHTQMALTLAETNDVDRYRLLLMADIGWLHLQMGNADAAVATFQDLVLHLDRSVRQGLARARAQSGLVAAFAAATRIGEAMQAAERAVRALQQANLLLSHCDVLAWACSAGGEATTAAMLTGAAERFFAIRETEREPMVALARDRALALIALRLGVEDLAYWQAQGACIGEDELVRLLERALPLA
jgi:predicted ATPase/DNA-binding winged helix-turn-helix (wHTH) protein